MSDLPLLLDSRSAVLAYALPMFIAGITTMLAGTFFTLDRTRVHARDRSEDMGSIYDSGFTFQDRPVSKWRVVVDGGAGGGLIGWLFGQHLVTFLSLMIPHCTRATQPSTVLFLCMSGLTAVVFALAALRWALAARFLAGILGGASIAMLLSLMAHPSLIVRLVLAAVTIILTTLSSLLLPVLMKNSWAGCLHTNMRLCTSSLGAFSFALSIALLQPHLTAGWTDPWVWERFYVQNGDNWGTSKEKGLIAGTAFLLILGYATDWLLHKRFGESPEIPQQQPWLAQSPHRQFLSR